MKFQYIATVAFSLLCGLVNAITIPYKDMTDMDIAKHFVVSAKAPGNLYSANTEARIIYPTGNTTWTVGELVNVTYSSADGVGETVSIFFFGKTEVVAGGPLTTTVFPFYVPVQAVSPNNETSLLLSVRRQNRYLQTVDSVIVKVLPGPPHTA